MYAQSSTREGAGPKKTAGAGPVTSLSRGGFSRGERKELISRRTSQGGDGVFRVGAT